MNEGYFHLLSEMEIIDKLMGYSFLHLICSKISPSICFLNFFQNKISLKIISKRYTLALASVVQLIGVSSH